MLQILSSSSTLRCEFQPSDNSALTKELQGDSCLALSFRLYECVKLEVNDYCDFCGERFYLFEAYRPKMISTVEWEYNIKLYGGESMVKRLLVLLNTDGSYEPNFSLTAKPIEHLRLVVQSMNNGMGHITDWKVGTVTGNDNITIDYRGTYCDEALRLIAEKSDTEWWIEGTTVNISRCEHGEPITLGYGEGLTNIEQATADNTKFFTRLFPIGSSKNIDASVYGSSRLQLPDGAQFVTRDEETFGIIDHYEQQAFADIYPHRIGTVSTVRSEQRTDDNGNPYSVFFFTDAALDFDPNDYEIAGRIKRLSFQEGSELAGLGEEEDGTYFLECNYNSTSHEFEIITIWPFDDDTPLPGQGLEPKPGDEYILWNIRMPESYYTQAEDELATAVAEYLDNRRQDISLWKCTTDHIYISENQISLAIGQRVKLLHPILFEQGFRLSRITKISRNANTPDLIDIEISDALSKGTMASITDDIADTKHYVQTAVESNMPDIIRSYDNTPPTDNNLFSARRSMQEFLNKKTNDRAKGRITFEQGLHINEYQPGITGGTIDYQANAELLSLVVRAFLSSPSFTSGLAGSGWRLWMQDALSHLEIDRLTVRQTMTVFQLLIEKIRSVGGVICVSAANGIIKEVIDTGEYYRISFETENNFAVGDLIRCQTFNTIPTTSTSTDLTQKYYWVQVAAADGGSILVEKAEFAGEIPSPGDEVVLMGNTDSEQRQNAILISATEDGQPRIDVLDGIKSKSFDGCLRARLGNLDGIQDSYFPLDNQPHGNGLYADNAYLRGSFLLTTGEDVLTKFQITEGKITSAVSALRDDITEDQSYLSNSTFSNGFDKWDTTNNTVFFLFGNKWFWANDSIISKKGEGASLATDGYRKVLRINNYFVEQRNENLRAIPEFPVTTEGLRQPLPVYLSFYYRCASAGTLRVYFKNVDKSGFVNFNSIDISEDILPSDTYRQFTADGLWNGTGDFHLEFSGDIFLYMLVLSTDSADALAYRYSTLFEQSERLVKISAAVWDRDEQLLQESGLVVRPDGSGLYANGPDGKTAIVGAYADGKVRLTGEEIILEGEVSANGNVKIHSDGTLEATNGKFTGEISSTQGSIGGFTITDHCIKAVDAWGAGTEFYLYSTSSGFLGWNGPNKQTVIGLNVAPAGTTPYQLKITDTNPAEFISKGGIYVNISGSTDDNIGIYCNGDLRVNAPGRNILNGTTVLNSQKPLLIATDMNASGQFTTIHQGVTTTVNIDGKTLTIINGIIVNIQ